MASKVVESCEMHDQWIEAGPALRSVDAGDRRVAGRIARKPVDGFRWKGDKLPRLQQRGCLGNRRCARLQEARPVHVRGRAARHR